MAINGEPGVASPGEVQAASPGAAARSDLQERIDRDFTYHAPKGDQAERYALIRRMARDFALYLVDATPRSREQSSALTHLEETVFWANAAIARNE